MTTENLDSRVPQGWSRPISDGVSVLLLGTYHMANPGLDTHNLDADDVLAPKRQEELRELTDELAEWNPDRIAVEQPYDEETEMNALYDKFRSGTRTYGGESEDVRGLNAETKRETRNEVIQIGFRLAEKLGHEQLCAIDDPTDIGNDDLEALDEREFEPERKVEYSVRDGEAVMQESQETLARSTVSEFLRWENQEEQLSFNHELMFEEGIKWGEGENFGGPRMLSGWYERNIRMVHHLWRAVERGDDRVLVLVGSGHIHALRHLLDESPMFHPVSPLPYLSKKE